MITERVVSYLNAYPQLALVVSFVKIVLTGSFLSKLKIAKVIPIFKGGNESNPENYRPISLLSIFNRTFEKLMYKR